jgi:hypothetical protein
MAAAAWAPGGEARDLGLGFWREGGFGRLLRREGMNGKSSGAAGRRGRNSEGERTKFGGARTRSSESEGDASGEKPASVFKRAIV